MRVFGTIYEEGKDKELHLVIHSTDEAPSIEIKLDKKN